LFQFKTELEALGSYKLLSHSIVMQYQQIMGHIWMCWIRDTMNALQV